MLRRIWRGRDGWGPFAAFAGLLLLFAASGAADWTATLIVAAPIAVLAAYAMHYAARQ